MSATSARLRRLAGLLLLVGVLVTWSPQTASAHAYLTSTSPADGSSLSVAPTRLRLAFSETVVPAATQIDVVAEDGKHYPVSDVRVVGEGGEEPSEVLATLPTLPKGAYRVSWQTLSADDLHRTAGVLVFGIGHAVAAAGLDEPVPAPGEVVLRWLVFGALALALGGALMGRLARRQAATAGAGWSRVAHRGELAGGSSGAVGALLLLGYQTSKAGSTELLSSSYGLRWGLREAGFLLLVGAAVGCRYRGRGPVLVLGAALVALGSALTGHSGAGQGVLSTRVVADAIHLTAAATWAGAVLVGLWFAWSVRDRRPRLELLAVLRAFGLPAAACVSLIIASGIYLTSGVVGSVDAALVTFYGRALLLKIGVFAVIGVLGLMNHFRLRRTAGAALRRSALAAEAGFAVVVLGLAAVITSGQPAVEPQLVKDPAAEVVPLQDSRVADLQQTLAVRPNLPGRNLVMVDVFDTRRPAPAPVQQVTVAVVDADGTDSPPVRAERLADGRWSAAVVLNSSGAARVEVTVRRPGLPDAVHAYNWAVGGTNATARTALVSTAPIKKELTMLWFAVTILLVGGWWVAMLVRLRRVSRRDTVVVSSPPDRSPADVAG
ncbi:copper resistance CopC/CopD family protein [Kribbella ginsengisoli]|uniref:Copper resistance CopC/CopD family protein n=1 Tax=Kribbella ginsengisoli TaxID=363865 RepID=A0ABP6YX15_9ACTN